MPGDRLANNVTSLGKGIVVKKGRELSGWKHVNKRNTGIAVIGNQATGLINNGSHYLEIGTGMDLRPDIVGSGSLSGCVVTLGLLLRVGHDGA